MTRIIVYRQYDEQWLSKPVSDFGASEWKGVNLDAD